MFDPYHLHPPPPICIVENPFVLYNFYLYCIFLICILYFPSVLYEFHFVLYDFSFALYNFYLYCKYVSFVLYDFTFALHPKDCSFKSRFDYHAIDYTFPITTINLHADSTEVYLTY